MDNWRTSSYSSGDGGQCVEVASGDEIMVRDTTDRPGPVLTVHPWRVARVRREREAALARAGSYPVSERGSRVLVHGTSIAT